MVRLKRMCCSSQTSTLLHNSETAECDSRLWHETFEHSTTACHVAFAGQSCCVHADSAKACRAKSAQAQTYRDSKEAWDDHQQVAWYGASKNHWQLLRMLAVSLTLSVRTSHMVALPALPLPQS